MCISKNLAKFIWIFAKLIGNFAEISRKSMILFSRNSKLFRQNFLFREIVIMQFPSYPLRGGSSGVQLDSPPSHDLTAKHAAGEVDP